MKSLFISTVVSFSVSLAILVSGCGSSQDSLEQRALQLDAVTYSPSSLFFGSQAVGTSSATQYVTFTNNSSTPLTFSGSSISTSEFAFAGTGTCNTTTAYAL